MQRRTAAALLVLLICGVRRSEAQRLNTTESAAVPLGPPSASVADAVDETGSAENIPLEAKRFADGIAARLRPIEMRLDRDLRLRSAGTALGLATAAVGALRGHRTLTVVGAEAIRLGLNRQLSAVHAHTGITIDPAVGSHGFAVTFSRTF